MKPIYEKLIGCPDEGFIVKEIHGIACNCPWHCHPEVELVLVQESQGYRIVGDDIQSLQRGDLVLLGPNLPHAYQHAGPIAVSPRAAHCILLQFEERLWSGLLKLPAMAPCASLARPRRRRIAHRRSYPQASGGAAHGDAASSRVASDRGVFGRARRVGAVAELQDDRRRRLHGPVDVPTNRNGSAASVNSSTKTIIVRFSLPRRPRWRI